MIARSTRRACATERGTGGSADRCREKSASIHARPPGASAAPITPRPTWLPSGLLCALQLRFQPDAVVAVEITGGLAHHGVAVPRARPEVFHVDIVVVVGDVVGERRDRPFAGFRAQTDTQVQDSEGPLDRFRVLVGLKLRLGSIGIVAAEDALKTAVAERQALFGEQRSFESRRVRHGVPRYVLRG